MIPEGLNSQKKFIVILASLTAVMVVISFFILFYVVPRIQKETDNLLVMKNELALLEARRGQIKKTEKLIEESADDLKRLDSLVVDRSNPLGFFESLYSTASSSGVSIDIGLASAGGSELRTGITYGINVSISAGGTGKQIYAFLNLLELSPYEIKIQDLSIAGGESQNSLFRLAMNVRALSR